MRYSLGFFGRLALTGGLGLTVLSGAQTQALAQARLPTPTVAQIFEQFDENNDGSIDEIEFRVNIIRVMGLLDTNRNGVIDRDEVKLSDARFAEADRNRDGVIDGVELIEAPFLSFEAFDIKADGKVTLEDFTQAVEALRT